MFVICFLVCFIIHGDSAIGHEVEIDSPIVDSIDSRIAEVLPVEYARQHPEDNIITTIIEGRAKQRLVKGKVKLILKTLILFKLLLFAVSLPLSAITAKILSWNAVAISLLALAASKLVLLRGMLPGQSGPSQIPPAPPIIIQSSSDPVRRLRGGPKIYIQQDSNIPDVEEEVHRRKRW